MIGFSCPTMGGVIGLGWPHTKDSFSLGVICLEWLSKGLATCRDSKKDFQNTATLNKDSSLLSLQLKQCSAPCDLNVNLSRL